MADVESNTLTETKNTEEKCEDNNQEEPISPINKEFSNNQGKVDILFQAAPNTPIMKKKKWKVELEKSIGGITSFLRRYLKLSPVESLFLYVNQAFAPSPDQTIKNLYECYGADGTLVLYYGTTQTWG